MKYCRIQIILAITYLFANPISAQSTIGGFIIDNSGDTIKSIFSVAKKKRVDKRNNLNFAEVLSGDSLVRFTPKNILGYKKGDNFYKCFRLDARDTTFFGQLITSGKVELYYAPVFDGKYCFKRKGERDFYELDSKTASVVQATEDTSSPGVVGYQQMVNPTIPNIKSNEGAFRDFFIEYFKDRRAIVNKLKHEFYTFSSIESMFREYND